MAESPATAHLVTMNKVGVFMDKLSRTSQGGKHYSNAKGRWKYKRIKRGKHQSISPKENKGCNVVCIIVIILLGLGLLGGAYRLVSRDALHGLWNLDGTTMYRFDGFGTGEMLLPNDSYSFQYEVNKKDKTVFINFDDDKANDYTYSFEVSGEKMALSRGTEKEFQIYEFTKE